MTHSKPPPEILLPEIVARLKAEAESLLPERDAARAAALLAKAESDARQVAFVAIDERFQRLWQAIWSLSPTEM